MMDAENTKTPEDKTRPPVSALRYGTPHELFAAIPQIRALTQHRPRSEEETPAEFVERLRSSSTPEEAVTFTSFAAQPKMAIWWGYECLRTMPTDLSEQDRTLMEMIAHWTTNPVDANRYRAMREALYAPKKTPAVFLGLAVGWSGGPIAPNDPATVPIFRAPRAINSAVLSCLAHVSLDQRPIHLARHIDLGASLFRVY